jgi:hypothetical protein
VGGFSGSWSLAATTSHDPCGLQAHLKQGTGTCAKPRRERRERREVPRALGGCSGGQLGRPWLDDAGQDRLAGRLGRENPLFSRWLVARRRRRRPAPDKAASRARGCSTLVGAHRGHRTHLHHHSTSNLRVHTTTSKTIQHHNHNHHHHHHHQPPVVCTCTTPTELAAT